jgi:ribose-phosphate pyrophosphokinase
MLVVGGSASIRLSEALAKEMGAKLAKSETKKFPDSETYVRINDDVKGEDVVLVQNAYPDDKIIEMFLLQDAVYENGAESLTTVIPYYGYARQDKLFNPGEAVSARCLAGHFEEDTDRLITIDIHTEKILDWFDVDSKNITAMHEVGRYLKTKGVDIVISPDKGGIERAKAAAVAADCDFDYLEKNRIDSHTVEMTPLKSDVVGRNVALVDDIISTGGTIITATRQLRDRGAKSVFAACTHGLFIGDAFERLRGVCNDVVSTDTLSNPATCVTVAPEITKALKEFGL